MSYYISLDQYLEKKKLDKGQLESTFQRQQRYNKFFAQCKTNNLSNYYT